MSEPTLEELADRVAEFGRQLVRPDLIQLFLDRHAARIAAALREYPTLKKISGDHDCVYIEALNKHVARIAELEAGGTRYLDLASAKDEYIAKLEKVVAAAKLVNAQRIVDLFEVEAAKPGVDPFVIDAMRAIMWAPYRKLADALAAVKAEAVSDE